MAAYHPQSNGKAERVIQTIKGLIRKLQVTSKQAWGQVLTDGGQCVQDGPA